MCGEEVFNKWFNPNEALFLIILPTSQLFQPLLSTNRNKETVLKEQVQGRVSRPWINTFLPVINKGIYTTTWRALHQ